MATEGDIELEQDKSNDNAISMAENMTTMSRKEKRKFLKKMRRKQLRRDTAIREREIAETMANDPEIVAKLRRLEEEEAERMERDRREFEERERRFVESLEVKKRQLEEEEERRKRDEESKRDLVNDGDEHEGNEGEDWEYVEEGPAEIIWKGNEIIVKKKKVKVPKKAPNLEKEKQESEGPISNPLAPQSEVFEDYKSAQEVLDSVAQQVPNFGTEQDKAHCPFHLKTGVCRFGARCSRVHFYPDKSCTILIKNMYSGPGLAWEQDEGLEHTDEEVERSFEEFYEDVHTEFLKFGEIVNFKVCKNASSHLRGNVYVHYKLLEAAVLAYQSMNGRYFAGKQLSCEFVNLTRWKVAICGEYMKSRLKTCSRGSACNFIHCFRNPGGDYEWADWEKPAPRYWLKEMAALFGYSNDRFRDENLSYHRKRSRSRGPDSPHKKSPSDEDGLSRSKYLQRHKGDREEKISTTENGHVKRRKTDKREHESSLRKKKEAYSSYIDSSGDSLLREKHTHDSRKRSKMKDEVDLSDSSSGSRSGRDGSSRKRIRSISKSKNKSDYREYKRKSDSLERDEDRSHNHGRKSSKLMSVIDESRIERDKNKHQRNRTQSQGSGKQSDFTDSESEIHRYRTDGKRRRSTKCSRKGKHDAESSDNASEGSMSLRSEKRPKKGRRRSRSKNDFDFLDDESNVKGRNRKERHGGTVKTNDIVRNEKSGFLKIDFDADKCPADLEKLKEKEKNDASLYGPGNSIFDANVDSNLSEKGLTPTRGPQSDEMEHISPVNENDETTSSQTAEAELEQAYRMAALKKLQEMRKSKDADIHSHENIVVEDAKHMRETRGADSRRRRI
ncbi:uncharacterized protein LOC141599074 [Silene latifolia]|uniref:uncharacterized protein LOC141599074 n=1 Tax=Silene latifolia TaxID=37657 RepID=UPI003D7876B2